MTVIPFKRLSSRSWWRWIVATLVGVVAIGVWAFVTDPANRPYTAFVALFVFICLLSLKRTRQWVEVGENGTVLVQQRLFRTHRAGIRKARSIRLRTNGGGAVQMLVQDADGRKAFAPLLMISMYIVDAQPPEVLAPLLTAVEAEKSKEAREVADKLRAQIAHLHAGGDVPSSPLAALRRDYTGVIATAGAAGAVGSVSDQV